MSLKTKFFSVIGASVAIAAFGTFAAAQDSTAPQADDKQKSERFERRASGKRGIHGGKFGGRHGFRGLRGIELSEAQREQIRVIRENNKPDQAVMDEMRTLFEAKRSGTLTAEQKERFKSLRQQSRAKGESIRAQIEAILTPEQKQQIEQRKQEMQKRREERRQMRQQSKQNAQKPVDN